MALISKPPANREARCLFCERAADPSPLAARTVYEDEGFHLSHQRNEEGPSALGILLLQSKPHVRHSGEFTDEQARRLGWIMRTATRALVAVQGAQWTYCYSFTEGVRHFHMILAARYPRLPPEYVRLRLDEWPGAPRGNDDALGALSQRLGEVFRAELPTRP